MENLFAMTQCHGSNKPDALGDRFRFGDLAIWRLDPPLHKAVATAARRQGLSLNKWVAATLERASGAGNA